MINDRYKQAQIFYEQLIVRGWIWGDLGSLSFKDFDGFFINTSSAFGAEFTRLALIENILYQRACKDAKWHAYVYKNNQEAKVCARICEPHLIAAAMRLEQGARLHLPHLCGVQNELKIIEKELVKDGKIDVFALAECLEKEQFVLTSKLGLCIRARNFANLSNLVCELILQARCCLLNEMK